MQKLQLCTITANRKMRATYVLTFGRQEVETTAIRMKATGVSIIQQHCRTTYAETMRAFNIKCDVTIDIAAE